MAKNGKNTTVIKKVITALVLLALSFGILWFVQRLLMPKYQKGVIEGSFTEEYYKEKVPHDVVFFGDCDAYESYSPIKTRNTESLLTSEAPASSISTSPTICLKTS